MPNLLQKGDNLAYFRGNASEMARNTQYMVVDLYVKVSILRLKREYLNLMHDQILEYPEFISWSSHSRFTAGSHNSTDGSHLTDRKNKASKD